MAPTRNTHNSALTRTRRWPGRPASEAPFPRTRVYAREASTLIQRVPRAPASIAITRDRSHVTPAESAGGAGDVVDRPRLAQIRRLVRENLPRLPGPGGFDLSYYDATEPLLEALEQVHGDLSTVSALSSGRWLACASMPQRADSSRPQPPGGRAELPPPLGRTAGGKSHRSPSGSSRRWSRPSAATSAAPRPSRVAPSRPAAGTPRPTGHADQAGLSDQVKRVRLAGGASPPGRRPRRTRTTGASACAASA